MKAMLLSLLLVYFLSNYIKPRSSFTLTRDFSDTVIFDPTSGPTNCSSINAYSSSFEKRCTCNSGGTYYTASEKGVKKTKCYQDSGRNKILIIRSVKSGFHRGGCGYSNRILQTHLHPYSHRSTEQWSIHTDSSPALFLAISTDIALT